MRCLAIETSCDETAVSLLEKKDSTLSILAEEISSQTEVHQRYGGVVPELASREHLANLPLMIDQLFEKQSLTWESIDLLAVTRGPGLKGCLLMGLGFAKGIALARGIRLLGINHIEGHIHSARIRHPDLTFPYLCLVVSGGHTEIVEVRALGEYRILARTIDDAAGEAFDKSANLLSLPYPGGPRLAALADSYRATHSGILPAGLSLPKVMREAADFSFSGLKTAIVLLIRKHAADMQHPEYVQALAAVIQESIVDSLIHKLKEAIRATGIRKISICGGVSANKRLEECARAIPDVQLYMPHTIHSMDNATMIGFVAMERSGRQSTSSELLSPLSRWPVEEIEQATI